MSSLALVTGGSGYFGRELVGALLAQGHRVRVLDLFRAADLPPHVEFLEGDVRHAATVERACRDASTVYHAASLVPLAKNARTAFDVNCNGTRVVLAACAKVGVGKVVHVSSSAVFGVPRYNPVDDAHPPEPGEAYGASKLCAEKACQAWSSKVDVTIVRPRTIMGAGRLGIMQILFEWIYTGRDVPVLGDGSNRYQFVHAQDLADACLAAAERPGFSIYNIGAEGFGTMRETLESLIAHAKSPSRVVALPDALFVPCMRAASKLGLSPLGAYHALMYKESFYFDLTRARAELDFRPRFDNEAMFREAYDWYVEHRDAVTGGSPSSHHRSAVRQGALRFLSLALLARRWATRSSL